MNLFKKRSGIYVAFPPTYLDLICGPTLPLQLHHCGNLYEVNENQRIVLSEYYLFTYVIIEWNPK